MNKKELLQIPTFCVLFWNHLYIGPDSRIWPCCKYPRRDSLHEKFTSDKSVIELMNIDHFKKLRMNSLSNIENEGCKRCFTDERSGKGSMRQHFNKTLFPETLVEDINYSLQNAGEMKTFSPSFIFPFFSNQCNLKCRMCNPEASNRIAKEVGDSEENSYIKNMWRFMIKEDLSNPSAKVIHTNVFDKLKNDNMFENVSVVRYAGGEPFLTDEFFEMTDYLISSNNAKDILLDINSNISVKSYKNKSIAEYLEFWISNFKHVSLTCSVDSYDKKELEYIRHGASFEIILDNLESIRALKRKYEGKFVPMISTVISLYNILSINEIVDFYEEHYFKDFGQQFLEFCFNPEIMSIKLLDEADLKLYHHRMFSKFIKSFSLSDEYKVDRLKKFLIHVSELDGIRKESFENTFPELNSLIHNKINNLEKTKS